MPIFFLNPKQYEYRMFAIFIGYRYTFNNHIKAFSTKNLLFEFKKARDKLITVYLLSKTGFNRNFRDYWGSK